MQSIALLTILCASPVCASGPLVRDSGETEIQSISVKATPFFIRRDEELRRVVDVDVKLTSTPVNLTLRVEAGVESFDVSCGDSASSTVVSRQIEVPDSSEPLEVKVTATIEGHSKMATAVIGPQRKWLIFVAASTHTDIGYTDLQPLCAELHNQNLDTAVNLIERYPQFQWNCEVAWKAENYLSSRNREQRERFLELAGEGRLGIESLYCNILTGLCSHEQLCRLTDFAYRMHREHGIGYQSATLNDVPTCVSSLPMVLAESGIQYFCNGINNTRAVTFDKMYAKSPCWWEGPDGSRVLAMFVRFYAGARLLELDSNLEGARRRIASKLREYEARDDYPYDAIFVNGAGSDNQPIRPRLAEIVSVWNDRYEFPKIILAPPSAFFEYIEKHSGDKLPLVRGSSGAYWEDGAGSSARETALCRRAHEAINSAERLLALAGRVAPQRAPYPRQMVNEVWRNCMLFDEHTWGASCRYWAKAWTDACKGRSLGDAPHEQYAAQWKIKSAFAEDAHHVSGELLQQGAEALSSLVRTEDRSLVVLNTAGWPRSDVIEVGLPQGEAVLDPAAASCRLEKTTLVAVEDVPGCGYKVLQYGPRADDVPEARPLEGTVIESRFYRVEFDAETGAVKSLVDKQLGRELVDREAGYRMNQYLYVAGGKGTRIEVVGVKGTPINRDSPAPQLSIFTSGRATLRRLSLGELGERMIVETSAAMTPRLTSEITVYNHVKRVDIVNRITKELTYDKEAVYFAFPFAAREPTIRYEEPLAIVQPDKDLLPGACRDWFAVQHFVEVDAGDTAVCWSTPDAPLVCLGDINRGRWQTELPLKNGHIFAYIMNNYWFTNYRAGQSGEFCCHFSLTNRKKADAAASARFGWAASNPLQVVKRDANAEAPLPAGSARLVHIAEANVLLMGMKQSRAGDALVLRLWEVSGKPTVAHVRLPFIRVEKATLCNLVEEPQQSLPVCDSTVAVPLRPSGLATLLLY